MDSAKPPAWPEPLLLDEASRLKALAVLAFCAEMTRLPGHWAPRLTPEKATAQTTPSRLTRVAHIWLFRPLVSAAVAEAIAFFNAEKLGRFEHEKPWSSVFCVALLAASAQATATTSMTALAVTQSLGDTLSFQVAGNFLAFNIHAPPE